MNIAIRITVAAALIALSVTCAPAYADSWLPQIGGSGGTQYSERCPQGQILNGFELRAGDDIDAIRAVCVTPSSPTVVSAPPLSNGSGGGWHGGGGGGLQQLLCPPGTPALAGIQVLYDGIDTISVDQIDIYCSSASGEQSPSEFPSNQFHAPVQGCTSGLLISCVTDGGKSSYGQERQLCTKGQIAIGMHGRSGNLVDAMGLICGPAPTFRPTAPAMGHTHPKETPLQRATRNATVTRDGNAATRAAAAVGKGIATPKASIKSSSVRVSKPAATGASRKAIIIVGGKPQEKAKQPTVQKRVKAYEEQHGH